MIQDEVLSLDDPLTKFFPQFESMVVAPMGDLDVPFEIARAPITIRNLLTHTSGFTYNPLVLGLGDVAYQYAELEVMSQKVSLEENLEMLAQIPLVAQPGASFNYSVSVDVLGAVIEKVTGQRLGDPTFDSGGGGMYSTAQDFLKYAEMVANGGVLNGVRYLSAETAAIHFQDLMPELGLEAFEVAFGEAAQYMKFGGGFGIKLEEDGSDRADYYFWGGAANTFFWIDISVRLIDIG